MSVEPASPPPCASAAPEGRAGLDRMLDAMLAQPHAAPAIAAQIEARYTQTRAVLVLDMSGFMRLTQRFGIVAFLAMIHRMRRAAIPAVEQHGGCVVKAEADNLLCLFDRPGDAVAAATAIMLRLEAGNAALHPEQHLAASVGIGYGPILNIDGCDIFGDEVNLASKLGEDTAGPGDILLTPRAMAALGGRVARPLAIEISGATVAYFQLARHG